MRGSKVREKHPKKLLEGGDSVIAFRKNNMQDGLCSLGGLTKREITLLKTKTRRMWV
jgi:hypothetical protein